MKQFLLEKILLIVVLICCSVNAYSAEEVLKFDSRVQVSKDGDLNVTETIKVRAEGKLVKRGLVRKLPVQYERKHSLSTLFSDPERPKIGGQYSISQVLIDGRISFDWTIDKRAYGEYLKFHDFFLATIQRPTVLLSVTYQKKDIDDEFNRHNFEKNVSVNALKRGVYIDYLEGYRQQNIFDHYLSRLWHGHLFSLNDRQDLQIQSVLKDGKGTGWFVKEEHNQLVIYIGSRNIFLEPGEYEYTIRYRYGRQSWRDNDLDKISWNVTGNDWPFAIHNASTTIEFPEPVKTSDLGLSAFTGYFGQTGDAYQIDELSPTSASLSATQTLEPRQGFTVDLSWPKGTINQIGNLTRFTNTVLMNKALFVLIAAWLAALLIYYRTWSKYGRDPVLTETIPQYQAPNDESPAVMRFVNREGEYDDRVFTSALISLATKGHIKIEKSVESSFKLHRMVPLWHKGLSYDEGALFNKLFKKHKIIDPDKTTHAEQLFRAQEAHMKYMNLRQSPETYLEQHSGRRFGLGFMEVFLWFFTLFFSIAQKTFDWGFFLVFTVAYFFLCRFANELIARRTKRGAAWVPQMEGFFQYLVMAENDELRAVHPLEKTPEVYQEYLPYAVALDIEDIWGEKFNNVLSDSVRAGLAAVYGSTELEFSDYTDAFSSKLTRRINTARKKNQRTRAKARASAYRSRSPSGSSSWGGSSSSGGGSSGGGSSGGGSGGGGGGGW